MNETPRWMQVMQAKHDVQMAAHQSAHGKLGELQVEPTQEQLDKDLEDRRAKGELFTQQKESE